MFTRRHVISASGGVLATGFAGCSSVLDAEPAMDLEVVNYRETAIEIGIDVFHPEADDRSDARIYGKTVEIPVMSGEEDIWREEGVARAQPCRIELHVRDTGQSYHTHYVPDVGSDDADTGVRINLNTDSNVDFHQY